MKIAIGCDRRGLGYKQKLAKHLEKTGYTVCDVGTYENAPCDYPIYGLEVAKLVSSGECEFGVVLCGTGTGISIAANKVKGVRCGVAYTDDVAKLLREHTDGNIIAFGETQMEYADVERRTDIFLHTSFLGEYHALRTKQLSDIEQGKDIQATPILDKNWASAEGTCCQK